MQFFGHVVLNINIPSIEHDFRLVYALINKKRPPRLSNKPEDIDLANRMLALKNKSNDLKNQVENNKRLNRSNVSTGVLNLNFPAISQEKIRELTLGVYQMKQAKYYNSENLDEEGKYRFECIKI